MPRAELLRQVRRRVVARECKLPPVHIGSKNEYVHVQNIPVPADETAIKQDHLPTGTRLARCRCPARPQPGKPTPCQPATPTSPLPRGCKGGAAIVQASPTHRRRAE